jgi:hypothetical protein
VQIKTKGGIRWLTVPLKQWKRGQLISEAKIDNSQDWKRSHRDQLKQAYANAPFCVDMLKVVDKVFSRDYDIISDLAIASIEALVSYYPNIAEGKLFVRSSVLGIAGTSSQRLIDICLALNATNYLTGHGAMDYLDHMAFEDKGISVEYIDYELVSYPQQHGEFTPYVSTLDLIANCGRDGVSLIRGCPIDWRSFIERFKQSRTEE